MSQYIPSLNNTCPCKRCQAHIALTPAQRAQNKYVKMLIHSLQQLERINSK